MLSIKRFSIFIAMVVFTVSIVAAQSNSGSEMSVVDTYLRETLEVIVIRETARADSREQKLRALEYIDEAIKNGNQNPEIRETLVYLTREGTRSVARVNGRVTNDYPDVRWQAARYLGQIGTEEAKDALIEILQVENHPTVLTEAIVALGNIGLNENNEVVSNIVRVARTFNTIKPDDVLAIAVIDALGKIARKTGSLNSDAIALLRDITSGRNIPQVRELARQLLAGFTSVGR